MTPPTINHFLGQEEVVRKFRVALEAAWNDVARLPHMLFVGPAGCGKTSLAQIAAREMGVNIHERLGQVLQHPGAVNGLLAGAQAKEIVFVDEAHELPVHCQTLLYRAMEDRKIFVNGRGDRTLSIAINDITVIAATTDEYALLSPLRERFKLVLSFRHYGEEPLREIVVQRAQMMQVRIDPQIAPEIAQRSRGTPRLAIRLLEACHRYARSKGEGEITLRHFEETVVVEELDALGLGPDDQRYLRLLGDQRGKPLRLHTLESTLGIHKRTIQTVIEPFLLRLGFVERSPVGRCITVKGLRHLGLVAERSETTISAAKEN